MEDDHALLPAVPVPAAAASAFTGQEAVPVPAAADIPESSHPHSGGGDDQMLQVHGVQVAEEVDNLQLPNRQGVQSFDSSYVEYLQGKDLYGDIENYLMSFFPEGETWDAHPWLLLHIRRAWALAYIENGLPDSAETFLSESITHPFQPILQLDQSLVRNASLTDLADEINFIGKCVRDNKCYYHPYATPGMLQTLVSDYMMLYLPNTRFTDAKKRSTDLWQFAVELRRVSRRSHMRCLVCTVTEFKSATIGDMVKHLQDRCPGSKMTPYLIEKYQAGGLLIPPVQPPVLSIRDRLVMASKKKEPSRKRARTSATENDSHGMLETILQSMTAEMNRAEAIAARVGKANVEMGQVINNMKGFVNAAHAATGTASASLSEAPKEGYATERTRAGENQPVNIAARTVSAAASASTSSPLFGTAGLPPIDLESDLDFDLLSKLQPGWETGNDWQTGNE